jgi:hypothetical protein
MNLLLRVSDWIDSGRPIDATAPGLLQLRELERDDLVELKTVYSDTGWNEMLVALTAEGRYEVQRLRATMQ